MYYVYQGCILFYPISPLKGEIYKGVFRRFPTKILPELGPKEQVAASQREPGRGEETAHAEAGKQEAMGWES